jgi:hypothetical protein
MNRWRVGEDRGSKETDGCPLTQEALEEMRRQDEREQREQEQAEKEVELEEKEAKYIQQLDGRVINTEKFRELIGEFDMERAMGESVAEGPATTQDEEIGESKQEELADEELAAVEKVIES